MAAAGILLSEEKFLCCVCQDLLTKPVSTPCGHNFCSACIDKYWENSDIYQCPLCKKAFSSRPELQVNTVMSELAAEFKALVQIKASTPDPQLPGAADVLCDICTETKENAVKSCVMCLASFCEVHLEPHQRVAGLKSHMLFDPVKSFDDRMCKTHSKITELYCRTDQTRICVLCIKTDHKSHSVVPLDEEYEAAMANIQKMIQLRREKIAEIENSVNVGEKEAEKEKEASVQVFTDLIRSTQRSQADLVEVMEETYAATKQKAEGFLTELRMEIAELQSRSSQLQQLSQSEDHHHFLQSFFSPFNTDWSNIDVRCHLSLEAVRGAVTLLKQRLDEIMEGLPEIKMKRMREHAVDLTLDPDTAHRSLVISQDGKQVKRTDTEQNLPNNPKRFDLCAEVLAKEGFTTGKFYYEVQVKGKTKWVVGVVRESIKRKKITNLSVRGGCWTFGLVEGKYKAFAAPPVEITLEEKLEKVGIFVDYNKGVVSFYDVNSKSHIYSFTGYNFTEKLYPYFCPQKKIEGTNSAPLIITPVPQTH